MISPDEAGTIELRVIDVQGRPVQYAVAMILDTRRSGSTDLNGSLVFPNVRVGAYAIRVRIVGFETATSDTVRVMPHQRTTVDFKLKDRPVQIGGPEPLKAGK